MGVVEEAEDVVIVVAAEWPQVVMVDARFAMDQEPATIVVVAVL